MLRTGAGHTPAYPSTVIHINEFRAQAFGQFIYRGPKYVHNRNVTLPSKTPYVNQHA